MRNNATGTSTSNQSDDSNFDDVRSAYATGVFAFGQEYNKQYSILIRNTDQQAAHIQLIE
ncbi:hypothetical protein AF72_08810 [Xylella taiwanensis]|uniref:Uncharacterized protein n=1 Tax=Xylella taiwanensis TaxID=1444770 RepID=Z9JI46_9GAMM|nr:hypothetical protein AB672_08675 [Xylella taiwanensis]EWS77869.1 hypothetical protein AF72_08810 [Xylella taiwanensis]